MTEWEHDDQYWLSEGVLNLWWNPKTCDGADFGNDPPVLRREVLDWMEERGVRYYPEPMVGPPLWVFSTSELRDEFKELFLETEERMREIIDEGVAREREKSRRLWIEQGSRVDSRGNKTYRHPELKLDVLFIDGDDINED